MKLTPFWLVSQDENIMRKKIFNMMEDMKGKIRVYARVRPVLGFETQRGALSPFFYDVLSSCISLVIWLLEPPVICGENEANEVLAIGTVMDKE